MAYQNKYYAVPHLNEKEATLLARAVQILVRELGYGPEEVERSYEESRAYFLKNDHFDQRTRGESHLTAQMSTIA
jgi:hypothetical protein